jgi:predicted permease
LSGLLPAWRASGQKLTAASRLRKFLIVAQVAGAVLVLSTAGLFIRSFQKAQTADLGFDTSHIVTADLDLRPMKLTRAQIAAFHRDVREHVGRLPGVVSVSLADVVPFGNTSVLDIPGRGQIAAATVDRDYFRAAGIRLVRGREPQADERDIALVNDTFARRFWPGEDPVGKSLAQSHGKAPLTVIGVVATGRYWSTDEPPRAFVYRIEADLGEIRAALVVRTQGPPAGMLSAVSQAIQSVDPALPALPVRTENDRIRRWLEPQRSAAVLLGFLGFSALGLAITALFALLAQMVVQRSAEIAVRVALGATRASIAGLLLRQSAVLMGAGSVIGLALAGAVGSLLAHNFGPLEGFDSVALAGVLALLAIAGAAGTLLPTWRAMRVDPVATLRAE